MCDSFLIIFICKKWIKQTSKQTNKTKQKVLWQDWHCCNRLVKCFDALFDQLTARASITKTSFSLLQLILCMPVAGTAMLLSLELQARSRWAFAWHHIVMAAFWGKLVERRLIHASTQTWYQEQSVLLVELKKFFPFFHTQQQRSGAVD